MVEVNKTCNKYYQLTKRFPKEELYCLMSKFVDSAISIPSNIAEGVARSSVKSSKFSFDFVGKCI